MAKGDSGGGWSGWGGGDGWAVVILGGVGLRRMLKKTFCSLRAMRSFRNISKCQVDVNSFIVLLKV